MSNYSNILQYSWYCQGSRRTLESSGTEHVILQVLHIKTGDWVGMQMYIWQKTVTASSFIHNQK